MKNLIHTAVVTLFAASAAHAQQAVQWKLIDGGNGDWYQFVRNLTIDWKAATTRAVSMGGHLATITDSPENAFIFGYLSAVSAWGAYERGPFLGGYQDRLAADYAEPSGGWRWVTGEPWYSSNWATYGFGEPNNDSGGSGPEDFLAMDNRGLGNCVWNDVALSGFAGGSTVPEARTAVGYLVEWSADCNSDGIVDYGQCHDGTLPDYNGNNLPDCCERSEPCVVGDYPMQWAVADAGNGHWYQIREMGLISWSQSRAAAQQLGGYLTTLTTASESAFVARLKFTNRGVNLGGFQDRSSPEFSEPSGGWRWVTGEPWSYANWLAGEPNNAGAGEDFLMFAQTNVWDDKWADQDELCPRCEPHFFAVEWDADCNNDGVVDYGQILQGQLVDANTNGIPDICEGPTCNDIDLNLNGIVDGGDLGILLAFWGPVSPAFPRADINKDGFVNGADLGIVLAFWGPCLN
jgi:hypothetical protein